MNDQTKQANSAALLDALWHRLQLLKQHCNDHKRYAQSTFNLGGMEGMRLQLDEIATWLLNHGYSPAENPGALTPKLDANDSNETNAEPVQSALWINVEISPGRDIISTCREAVRLADLLSVMVWFQFNGVKCGARPGDSPELLEQNWRCAIQSRGQCTVACANPISPPKQ